ncbi:hypothetical protein Tco_0830035 [Tanacetum coccineum]
MTHLYRTRSTTGTGTSSGMPHHYDDLLQCRATTEEPERTVKATVRCGTETFLDNVEGLEPERLKMLEGSPFHKLLKLKRDNQHYHKHEDVKERTLKSSCSI